MLLLEFCCRDGLLSSGGRGIGSMAKSRKTLCVHSSGLHYHKTVALSFALVGMTKHDKILATEEQIRRGRVYDIVAAMAINKLAFGLGRSSLW